MISWPERVRGQRTERVLDRMSHRKEIAMTRTDETARTHPQR
jgi:hypothetical protein